MGSQYARELPNSNSQFAAASSMYAHQDGQHHELTSLVISESLEIVGGTIFEIAGGNRVEITGAATQSIGLIGYNSYSPAANTIFSTTSSTWANCDATNMKVTFIAPASGKILVRLSGYCDLSVNTQQYFWALKKSGVDVLGSGGLVTRAIDGFAVSSAFILTGLVPGESITYTWTHAVSGGATGRTLAGPGLNAATASTSAGMPPAVMEVWSTN